MPLTRLSLRGFRNFSKLDLEFHPEFNFVYGRNAQGKTNLIEAIYYLSALKSFRTNEKTELIAKGAEFAKIDVVYVKDDLNWDLALTIAPGQRQVLINQKRPQTRKEYHELIPLILFEPRHIYLFRGTPSERRQYLNRALFLQDPGVLTLFNDYDKVVHQKNRLLKDRASREQIEVWNERLADLGAQIIFLRQSWFQDIKTELAKEYRAISGTGENLSLTYFPTQSVLEDLQNELMLSCEDVRLALRETLATRLYDEIERRESFVGPHRDNWMADLDGRVLGKFGSQGENRSAVIALKLAQLKLFAAKFGKTPLFLLDDVASELDEKRCRYLFQYLRDESAQVFLTTTENGIAHDEFKGRSSAFLVENGHVSPFKTDL